MSLDIGEVIKDTTTHTHTHTHTHMGADPGDVPCAVGVGSGRDVALLQHGEGHRVQPSTPVAFMRLQPTAGGTNNA
jgi:hypothetical protein